MNEIDYSMNLELERHGIVGMVNDISTTFLIKKCNDSVENSYDLNTLISKIKFKQGSIITISDIYYLALDIEEQFSNTIYSKGTIRKCTKLKLGEDNLFKNKRDVIGFIDKDKAAIVSNDFFLQENSYINVTIPFEQYNFNDKYINFMDKSYMIVSTDDTKDGLITLYAKFKEIFVIKDVYEIECNTNIVSINVGENFNINPVVKNNGEILSDAILKEIVEDDSICSYKNGVINGISKGTTKIILSYEDKVTYQINIIVNEISVNYEIIGSDNFKQIEECEYKINPLIDCEFYIDDFDSEYIASIILDDKKGNCKVKGIKAISSNYFTLYAKKDNVVIAKKKIDVLRK
ncbi:hypothetical protein DV092_11380 [Clostridium botulinum]|nr:hypothetical protein [Clostridium botulinum]